MKLAAVWRGLFPKVRALLIVPPIEVVPRRVAQIRATRVAFLGVLLGAVTVSVVWHKMPAPEKPMIKALAVAPALFDVGEYKCARNDGLLEIIVKPPVNDYYIFVCKDGARFDDTYVRVIQTLPRQKRLSLSAATPHTTPPQLLPPP